MAIEIERKFLVNKELWTKLEKGQGIFYRQGYLLTDPLKTIRVRVSDKKSFLTFKGISKGATRLEFEYEIDSEDANQLLDEFSLSEVSKIRYEVRHKGKVWEVDEFLDENQGLIVAEIELTTESENFDIPLWIVKEVTEDDRYYNSNLSLRPFKTWEQEK